MNNELKILIGKEEKILWEGKPNKKCYIFESIVNPLLPFALIWLLVDSLFFGATLLTGDGEGMLVIIPFLLIHMAPVWIYLSGVLLTNRRYKNTAYIITDKAIYVSGGTFAQNFNMKPFAELSHIDLHRGIFDQKFNVGDIIATTNQMGINGTRGMPSDAIICINSISDYTEVYSLVKKLQTDIYTDVMYPNAKRPAENPGYNTEYKGL